MIGHEKETGRVEMDFADWWDKWLGQLDPFKVDYTSAAGDDVEWKVFF